jgi:hypothetical protein
MKTDAKLPSNLESVMSLRGDSRVLTNYQGRDNNLAKITRQIVWHCKICDEFFETLAEAREHKHG